MADLTPFQMMEDYLSKHYAFLHNVVLNTVDYLSIEQIDESGKVDDYKLNSIHAELLRRKIHVSKSTLINYLFSENSTQYDPFQNYFEELPQWRPDQPNYIQLLANTMTVSEAFKGQWITYLTHWLIATVACAIDAKVTNQQVLVLIGEQGIGKTKWTEKLVPKSLKKYYYSGSVNPGDKDSSINLAECFLINLDELGNLNRGDLNTLKQLITQSSIRVRRPYAAIHDIMPRRASFVGSVNNQEFLRDDTGNRRYLCIEAQTIDYEHSINMDMVYAQAYYLLRIGTPYWFSDDEVKLINLVNNRYRVQYPELEYVNEFFEACSRDEKEAMEMTTTQILAYLNAHGTRKANISVRMLGIALRASDYVKVKKNGGTNYYKLKVRKPTQVRKDE